MKDPKLTIHPSESLPIDDPSHTAAESKYSSNRRQFLSTVGQVTAATLTGSFIADQVQAQSSRVTNRTEDVLSRDNSELGSSALRRVRKAYRCRMDAAEMASKRTLPFQIDNRDEARYANKIGTFTKALPHNNLGEVDLAAYATMVKARQSQDPAEFENIQLGLGRKLTSPQAGLAMDLQGPDSHHVTLPPAPRFSSAEEAGEIVELYWMALARDVNFTDYDNSPIIAAAAADISQLSDFRGPKQQGRITPTTIFRNATPGDLNGPWLSQFLLLDFSFGANYFSQKIKTLPANKDYMTNYNDWLNVQNGADPSANIEYDPTPRYMRNLRDLAQWVHIDALYQAYLQACLILMERGTRLDPGLPLADSRTQLPFAQCGGPHILSLVTEVATRALKAVWYQKWFVHNRLRPETFAGRVHNHVTGAARYPIHRDVLNSSVLRAVHQKYGTFLLPQAFPEGSPTHGAYGAGHATVAGACTTILKAFFDESDIIRNPRIPNEDGTALIPYVGPTLTVGGELDKVASNVANGRNGAGVHWRSDAVNSLRLGEEVAIGILQEQKLTYNEDVTMTLTKFDGSRITI
jgi:hypothetical protein